MATQEEFERRMLRYLDDAERRYAAMAEDPWCAELRDKAKEMAAKLRDKKK